MIRARILAAAHGLGAALGSLAVRPSARPRDFADWRNARLLWPGADQEPGPQPGKDAPPWN